MSAKCGSNETPVTCGSNYITNELHYYKTTLLSIKLPKHLFTSLAQIPQ